MKELVDLHQINTERGRPIEQGRKREPKGPLSDDAEDHFVIATFERCFRTANREQQMAQCEQYEREQDAAGFWSRTERIGC